MLPLELFSNKTFSGVNLLTFFLYAALTAGMLFLGLNMIQVQHYSQLQAGLTLLPFSLLMVSLARYSGKLSDKYGPRWLLIAGPATAGLGFLLLSFVKETSGPSEYWTTYFPGILVFGLGMSFTVAPLTSTVMGSVPDHFSGTASGVNNAITRISGVFANAILGALALLLFSSYLENGMTDLRLNSNTRQSVMAEAENLGNAAVPAGISERQRRIIEETYNNGFIASYSIVMLICAGMALLGSLMSFFLVKNPVSHHAGEQT